jgi:hypothetical protein
MGVSGEMIEGASLQAKGGSRAYDGPMKNSDVPRETMRRAVQLCGGIDALGDALNVSTATLEKWLAGKEEPSSEVFTQAVGLLLEATARRPPPARSSEPPKSGRKERPH